MIHRLEVQVLILLLIASLVGIAARRLRLPYTLALVVAGLGLSFVHLEALSDLRLTPDLLLLLFLPPLLFEAAYHLPLADLRRNLAHIASLGIVNSREHLESLFVAWEQQVGSLQEYMARQHLDVDAYDVATVSTRGLPR